MVSVFWLLLLLVQFWLRLADHPPADHDRQPTIVSLGRSITGSFTVANSCTLARVAQA